MADAARLLRWYTVGAEKALCYGGENGIPTHARRVYVCVDVCVDVCVSVCAGVQAYYICMFL